MRDPLGFANDPVDADIWDAALIDIAAPSTIKQPLREAQIAAWRGLATARVGLILGPPGTGKTHLLAWMAAAYLEARRRQGLPCRILVTAFTRNAIINLIEAIAKRCPTEMPTRIIFAGREPSALLVNAEHLEIDAVASLLDEPYVVIGMTVWGLNELIHEQGGFTGSFFHLTCIDEASQMVLSHGLMAIAGMSEQGRVLVAGDNKQLPPIRIEHEHDLDGRRLGSSLYAFLQSGGVPEFPLDETFRLNEPLTRFPRDRFYSDRYRSADPNRKLQLVDGWAEGLEDWERVALDPAYPICVLIHDGPASGCSNPFEANIAARLGRALFRRQPPVAPGAPDAEKWQDRLAIVSPHRAQNKLIRDMLGYGPEGLDAVVETVDRIQGRERDAILVSYTVSDPEFALAEAEFIFSPERLNVTVTRARAKLIVIISRRLLEVVPSEEELVDKAETLREFVYRARYVDRIMLTAPDNRLVNVDLCVVPFDDSDQLPKIQPPQRPKQQHLAPLTSRHRLLLSMIADSAIKNKWGTVADYEIARDLRSTAAEVFPELRLLQRHGTITLDRRSGKSPFWSVRPLSIPREPFTIVDPAFADRVEEALMLAGTRRYGARYERVRDAFDWLGESGDDLFKPALDDLETAGLIRYEMKHEHLYVSRFRPEADSTKSNYVPLDEGLEFDDWVLLNHLEDIEARRINFGVFEEWHAPIELAKANHISLNDVTQALRRLDRHGLVLVADEGRVRSRMAEMARVVRYIKQRFRKDDAADRPYLVRGLKIELRNREKPAYDTLLSKIVDNLVAQYGASDASRAVNMVAEMLRKAWQSDAPHLAAFQSRAFTAIYGAWMTQGDNRFVIAADTGSGKTEAACLPIIAGTLRDRLAGGNGTRAILVYPRVRLAANQSQRLARYLASLASLDGAPVLTLGLQNGDVPESWAKADVQTWEPTGRSGEYRFPFFTCPEANCGAQLLIVASVGAVGADRLHCKRCGWHFNGWIGTKASLRESPPNLFLPTTESLHQWLNDGRYGRLFGDLTNGPRVVLADEIHLYTHIQGAQVGYSLRRLLARASLNGAPPIAVGMSATLGRPEHVWNQLVGGSAATLIQPEQQERRKNPRGREYFYFIQPEVESRNRDVAGASTTIQAAMALAHNMHRRHGEEGGFRGIVFVDSIDKLKRLHGNYMDAEAGQNLASLRTRVFPDHPVTGSPRRQCCGDPLGCDQFLDGECWKFAATDLRQWTANGPYIAGNPLAVAGIPVYSGSGARIEEEIERSDLVFSTASLEVGYDDPDMAFVFQHYAPSNIASFIQRKGRAGRGNDDRPVTGVTLSIYSSRDSWFYNRPNALIDSRGFDVPLNLGNPIVLRGQLAALILDLIARREAQSIQSIRADGGLVDELVNEFEMVCDRLFDAKPFARLGYSDAKAFIADLLQRFGRFRREWPSERRARIGWLPRNLFGSANLPTIDFSVPVDGGVPNRRTESIALGLAASAPGNATRRWGKTEVHWRAPQQGQAPFLTAAEEADAERLDLGIGRDLLTELPIDAREDMGDAPVADAVLRPTTLSLNLIGTARGGSWTPLIEWDPQSYSARTIPDNSNSNMEIDIRSTGSLRGFPLVRFSRDPDPIEPGALSRIVTAVGAHVGSSTRGTGLQLARLYWGADAEIRVVRQTESIGVSQTFTVANGQHAQLVGYAMESEGVCFTLDSTAIDAFIEGEMLRLASVSAEVRWHRNQMLRYIVQRRARNAGINGYEARRAAELVVTAVDTPKLAAELSKLLKMWSDAGLATLFKLTYRDALISHPLLSERRIDRLITALAGTQFKELLLHVFEASRSDDTLRSFLRSQLLHSLAVRLRQSFVLHGGGDERSVVAHVKLPIQFGKRADDVITIVENGIGGDGTTRTFVEHTKAAFGAFMHGFANTCPNAAEDTLLADAYAAGDHHQAWRNLDPRRPETLQTIGAVLGINFETPDSPSPQQLLRILFTTESIAGHQFALYDLWQEAMATRIALATEMGREPDAWEIVSAASQGASNGFYPTFAAALAAYGQIEGAPQDENLSPKQRLADQIYRLSGRLCFDGCLACLHGDSDLMADGLAEVAVSRRLLARYIATLSPMS